MSHNQLQIAVVGCGIAGLSTALAIQDRLPSSSVHIVTEQIPGCNVTASEVAAGLWSPLYLPNTPDEKVNKWSERTYNYLQQMMKLEPDPHIHGVRYCPGYKLFSSIEPAKLSWEHVPIAFRNATPRELALFPGANSGYFYVTVLTEGRRITSFFMKKFISRGGRIHQVGHVKDFDDVHRMGYNYIFNCTGLGSNELCNDKSIQPYRGQVMRIKAPWLNNFAFFSDLYTGLDTYILPNVETIVIGGVYQGENWNLKEDSGDREDILRRVYQLMPHLKSAPIVETAIGLRPVRRSGVRVEYQSKLSKTGTNYHLFHNYGFGGSGLTIFQGCAEEVTELLVTELQKTRSKL